MTDAAKSRKSVHIEAIEKRNTETLRKARPPSSNRYSVAGHLLPNVKPGERSLQATYRLVSKQPLNVERMYNITKNTVDLAIANSALERYKPVKANRFCQNLAREIQKRLVCEDFERFRIVVVVTMVEKLNQSGQAQLGFLWEAEQDQWTDYHRECQDFVVNAMVAGVYYE